MRAQPMRALFDKETVQHEPAVEEEEAAAKEEEEAERRRVVRRFLRS